MSLDIKQIEEVLEKIIQDCVREGLLPSFKEVMTSLARFFGEGNPGEGKLSSNSILGKSFVGKKVGSRVKVTLPAGSRVYKILKVN